jgi:hypothetical protein
MFQTEYEFAPPFGYVDADGTLHRDGVMRLATAADDPAARGSARAAEPSVSHRHPVSRVVTRLGSIVQTPKTVEAVGRDLRICRSHNRINGNGAATVALCPARARVRRGDAAVGT